MTRTRSHDARPEGRGERAKAASENAARSCSGTHAAAEPGAEGLEATDPSLRDLPDVSGLLARMLDERIPLALIADLASPKGPNSDQIMASERQDVG
ncbi:hypothetical protein SAMN05216410_2036 [Sanguibacter gelidistatuariae]|uniref:Uncharacterized protein n=1 Tax=Sanguibacter gelidistatuariae TaxID=1814289 RepID=A0A1G6N315_9MICO|nr:hypothetical protein [Sanguibacter gelidistatuariae]SDC62091.1 hypothetical protein SAMN05216410_2036 [Sanguibacter gelidistatuariae]